MEASWYACMAWVETWEDNLEATSALLSNLPANVLMEEVEEEVVEDQVHHQTPGGGHPLLHQHQVVVAARANGVYCTLDLTAEVHAGR